MHDAAKLRHAERRRLRNHVRTRGDLHYLRSLIAAVVARPNESGRIFRPPAGHR